MSPFSHILNSPYHSPQLKETAFSHPNHHLTHIPIQYNNDHGNDASQQLTDKPKFNGLVNFHTVNDIVPPPNNKLTVNNTPSSSSFYMEYPQTHFPQQTQPVQPVPNTNKSFNHAHKSQPPPGSSQHSSRVPSQDNQRVSYVSASINNFDTLYVIDAQPSISSFNQAAPPFYQTSLPLSSHAHSNVSFYCKKALNFDTSRSIHKSNQV